MKLFNGILILNIVFFSSNLFAADDCPVNDDYGNETIYSFHYKMSANIGKMVRSVFLDGTKQIGFTHCVDNDVWGGVDKEDAVLGVNHNRFYQCKDATCLEKKMIADNYIEIFPNYLASKCNFTVPVDENYGVNCESWLDAPSPYVYTGCAGNDYCVSNDLKFNTKKIIRVGVQGAGYSAMTACISRFDRIVVNNLKGLKPNSKYVIKYYQCKDFDCDEYKEIDSDEVVVDSNSNLDHEKYNLKVDAVYGKNCSTPSV